MLVARPHAVLFDVFETLFALESLGPRLQRVGLGHRQLPLWFARTLRDAFALSVAGRYASFREVAGAVLEGLVVEHGRPLQSEQIEWVLAGFEELRPHPDVAPAFERLQMGGVRIALASNGSSNTTWMLLRRAGLERYVDGVFSTDDVRRFKPQREVYHSAVAQLALPPGKVALVATHPWDVQGAQAAGLVGAWIRRREPLYPRAMGRPDLRADDLETLCAQLLHPTPHGVEMVPEGAVLQ